MSRWGRDLRLLRAKGGGEGRRGKIEARDEVDEYAGDMELIGVRGFKETISRLGGICNEGRAKLERWR